MQLLALTVRALMVTTFAGCNAPTDNGWQMMIQQWLEISGGSNIMRIVMLYLAHLVLTIGALYF